MHQFLGILVTKIRKSIPVIESDLFNSHQFHIYDYLAAQNHISMCTHKEWFKNELNMRHKRTKTTTDILHIGTVVRFLLRMHTSEIHRIFSMDRILTLHLKFHPLYIWESCFIYYPSKTIAQTVCILSWWCFGLFHISIIRKHVLICGKTANDNKFYAKRLSNRPRFHRECWTVPFI